MKLAGSPRTVFGVCANEWSPDDGRVVSMDHGCGAHSETHGPEPVSLWQSSEPVIDERDLEVLATHPVAPEVVASVDDGAAEAPAEETGGSDEADVTVGSDEADVTAGSDEADVPARSDEAGVTAGSDDDAAGPRSADVPAQIAGEQEGEQAADAVAGLDTTEPAAGTTEPAGTSELTTEPTAEPTTDGSPDQA
jgi:hypothetical protein